MGVSFKFRLKRRPPPAPLRGQADKMVGAKTLPFPGCAGWNFKATLP